MGVLSAPTKQQLHQAGRALAAAREEKGLTQAQLAALLGAKERTVRAWENGTRPMTERTVVAIAGALPVRPSALRWSTYPAQTSRPDRDEGEQEVARPEGDSRDQEEADGLPPPDGDHAHLLAAIQGLGSLSSDDRVGMLIRVLLNFSKADADRAEADKIKARQPVELTSEVRRMIEVVVGSSREAGASGQ